MSTVTLQVISKWQKLGRLSLVGALCFGCAGHSARTRDAREALNAGNPKLALASINEQLEVESEKELPKDVTGDQALLLLDRAVILQQLGDYKLSARDLEAADKQVEMMDFSRSTLDDIGRYVFSDDTGPYKAPPYEKLMLNTMNMLNYLVQGNLSGGRIEARRFAIMQKYLKDNSSAGADLLGPGSYFAGFIFEKSKDPTSAILYYEEALKATQFRSLNDAVVDLAGGMARPPENIKKLLDARPAAAVGASNSGVASEGGVLVADLGKPTAVAEESRAVSDATSTGAAPGEEKDAELLIVINYGRVPAKEALRLPIGLAITAAGQSLPPEQRTSAVQQASLKGAVTWVNFPTLPKPKPLSMTAKATIDAVEVPGDTVSVDELVLSAWDQAKGAIIASAITRAVTRAVAGEVAQVAGGKTFGLLLNLATQVTMTAVDTPDTRSWATLPARITIARVKVKPGEHQVELGAGKFSNKFTVNLPPGGWKALSFTVLSQ